MEELGAQDRLIVTRARRLQRFLTQPFAVTEAFTGVAGKTVRLADTLAGCRAILDGEADDWPEASLYMIGNLADARQTMRRRGGDHMRLLITDPTAIVADCADVTACAPRTKAAASVSCGVMPIC